MPATDAPLVERQPVAVFVSGLAGVVALGLAAATALDWVDLTFEQCTIVVAFVTAACALCGGALWGAVYSPATVADLTAPLVPPEQPGEFP